MNSFRPISISLSPNTERDDLSLSKKIIFRPWLWKKGEKIKELEEEFKKLFNAKYAISFNSGRSSLLAILKSLNLNENDEILLQAFTCNATVNPILWAGLKPVFIDVDEKTFNLDVEDLKKKITPQSKAVLVQNTFGLPAEMEEILEVCQKNNLILIEDCAHALGATYRGQKIGTFGLASFFSFSRDKVISSVYGGMAITNDPSLAEKLRQAQDKLGYPSYYWIFQQLLHPILTNCLILPTYSIFGKYLLVLLQWLGILSKAVHWEEKRGRSPYYFPKRLPNALAELALKQFKKLEKFNQHRQEIAKFYYNELQETNFKLPTRFDDRKHVFLRFAIKHPKAHEIIKKAWKENLLIGDWYDKVIAPHDTKLDKMKYLPGSCPKAEKLAKITLNLPTCINISQKEALKIVEFLSSIE